MKNIDRKTAIKAINRFEEIGVFEMECVKERCPLDKDKLIGLIEWLYSDDELIRKARKIIEMDDDSFRLHKPFAKLWIGTTDFRKGFNQYKYLRLF